jgi:hypothetical protein
VAEDDLWEQNRDWWQRVVHQGRTRVVVLAIIVVAAASVGFVVSRKDSGPTFCPADALRGPNGQLYGRSSKYGCRFVDENGQLVTEVNGQPLCYDASRTARVGKDCE